MLKYLLLPFFVICSFVLSSCGNETDTSDSSAQGSVVSILNETLKETFLTARNETDNVDSPAIWHGQNGEHWVITTAKETDKLLVHDATTGELIRTVGSTGSGEGQFRRPNGIFVVDNRAVVVERDNKRAQVFRLPGFDPIGSFGSNLFKSPYGIAMYRMMENRYQVYITDNYETSDGTVPPDAELNNRVHSFELFYEEGDIRAKYIKSFGDTEGDGVLKVVESICVDPLNNILLIADEDPSEKNIKVYDKQGNFTGMVISSDMFKSEPEGIALYQCDATEGFWIVTDQSETENWFHILDRKTFELLGSFSGETTRNTDGICITNSSFGNFPQGAFYAVHDDGNVACFSWEEILASLNLEGKCGNTSASL